MVKESKLELSAKGKKLIKMYEIMANQGYARVDGVVVTDAFSDFEIRFYREFIKPILLDYGIESILDYGAGGSDWEKANFDENGQSAKSYFNLQDVYKYEPARNVDQRQCVDCVVCFDVLEHIYI